MNQHHNNLFSDILVKWYHSNKRNLPWRNINNPYNIWISEIILQQTRVNQGMDYYLRFIERFPDSTTLANAEEDEVLKYWQGLGYYSRARNLHKAAKQIQKDFNGRFPQNHKDILSLPGIGEYTAAAISSFAYNLPFAVVDGNVYRVLSRLFNINTPIDSGKGKKEFAKIAMEILNTEDPATHNQAIMEFGALYCTPNSPDCVNCPFAVNCLAYQNHEVASLPVKSNKTKVSNRYFNYLFIKFNGRTFLQKRTAKDIWQNLHEFPLIETSQLLSENELLNNDSFQKYFNGINEVKLLKKTNPLKHVLSHRVIYAQFFSIEISELNQQLNEMIQIPISSIDDFAVSRLMELFLVTI